MNELLFDACISYACEHLENAIEQLFSAIDVSECTDDKERIKNLIYDLRLIYDKLV